MSTEDEKLNHLNTPTTGEDLIIDEDTVHEHKHEHPLSCSCTKTQSIIELNSDNKMTEKFQTIKMKQIIKL